MNLGRQICTQPLGYILRVQLSSSPKRNSNSHTYFLLLVIIDMSLNVKIRLTII